MSHVETLTPKDLLGRLYDEEFGLDPDSGSIKPVHVANGLARSLTARAYDTAPLARTLRRWVRDQRLGVDREQNPTRTIIDEYAVAFARGADTDPGRVNVLRALARDVLGADDAVFNQPDKSSYTLSNGRFVTIDPSDHRAGLFLARLVTAGENGDAATLLLELLADSSDPYSMLAGPLLAMAAERPAPSNEGTPQAEALNSLLAVGDETGRLRSPTLAALRGSFDRLARFERREGSKLNSLRRLVLFGCFVIHVHMTGRWSEAQPGAPRPPILLDMFDGSRLPLRDASRASLRASREALEGILSNRLLAFFGELTDVAATRMLADEGTAGKDQDALRRFYATHRADEGATAGSAMASAYLDVGITVSRSHPIGFLVELGRRAGYLTPWVNQGRGGKLQKRYGVTAEFLETLVAATVEPGDLVDFGAFLDGLRDTFGVLAGRARDDEAIRNCNLDGTPWTAPTSIAEEDLRMNVEALRVALLETGYAREYADGQTVVASTPESEAII